MPSLIKSLIGKTRQEPAPEEVEAFQRSIQVLQLRAQKIAQAAPVAPQRDAA
jgi:hypothetical protein